MSNRPSVDDNDEEITQANVLLNKVDALLHRHQHTAQPNPSARTDIPLLTDIVKEPQPAVVRPVRTSTQAQKMERPAFSERQIGMLQTLLDIEISRALESWLTHDLPAVLARELDSLTDRLHMEMLSSMKATLLPVLSEHLLQKLQSRKDTDL